MMNTRTAEIWVGIFVAAGLAALFMLAMKVSNLSAYSSATGYDVTARFDDASGLKVRSPVTMAGVTLGRVSGISFDPKTYQAVVTLRIEGQYTTLPDGTSANIYTAGLLGEKYVGLLPGPASNPCEDEKLQAELEGRQPNLTGLDCKPHYLKQGSNIKLTQGSLVLEKLIAEFVSKFMDKGDSGKDKTQSK
ncbi:MAG: outer membrane lipid asymmetry maintenance protein MlaD [Gammaproteobacteria bacterium]|nr:outer membrane lipid asymmetry maintenance protein MlaD [Gammaproteobacteria bacterium]